jgi:hypothetical protein
MRHRFFASIGAFGAKVWDGAERANGRDVTFPDGKMLFAGSTGAGAPDEKPEK